MECKRKAGRIAHLIVAPFIYVMAIPVILIDIFFELYQQICFRLLSIPLLKRADYIRIDRHRLSYLGPMDKINCAYCGYANGVLHYASSISGETERYWCGIKHEHVKGFKEPEHHKDFVKYNDVKTFKKRFKKTL